MNLRGWLLYGALLAVAAAVAFASHAQQELSPTPSVLNPGPQGLKALYTYLAETGRAVSVQNASLETLPKETQTLVLPAPTERVVNAEETAALSRFVEGGGTLVYLAPKKGAQPRVDEWLGLAQGERLKSSSDQGLIDDALGVTVPVLLPFGAANGLHALRAGSGSGIQSAAPAARVAAQGGALILWRRIGAGEVWIFAGADLAENERIELLDNLALWENLAAKGLMVFDELHHHPASEPGPLSAGRRALVFQLAACALMFAWARGARLGPPRAEVRAKQRSSTEYVSAMSALIERAHVEGALLDELDARFRRMLHERLGVSLDASEDEVARQIEEQCAIPATQVRHARDELKRARKGVPGSREYLRVARTFAELELAIESI